MTFAHPSWLWALLVVLVVAALPFASSTLRRRALARFGVGAEAMTLGSSTVLRTVRAVLLVLASASLAFALAGPQYGSRSRILRQRGIDVVVALDFSKSMLATDVRPNRIERAKAEVIRFVEELEGDRVGMVAFAGETMEFPMTSDYAALGLFLRDLGPYDMPVGGTAIARALVSAGRLFERADASRHRGDGPEAAATARSRVVILMTDGEDHEGDPVAAARELAEQGVRVYTIGIGTRSGEMIPTYAPDGTWTGYLRDEAGQPVRTSLTEENERQLRAIAEAAQGTYYEAGRGSVGIDRIRADMRRMHQDEQRTRRITVQEGRYALALFPAFLLLLLEALLPEGWLGRLRRVITARNKKPARASEGSR